MKRTIKRIGIVVLVLIILALCTMEPKELQPEMEMTPYMSDCVGR